MEIKAINKLLHANIIRETLIKQKYKISSENWD